MLPIPPKPPGGRRTTLTDAIISDITDKVANSASFKDACLLSGVAVTAGQLWLDKGRAGQKASGEDPEIYIRFAEEHDKACARRRTMLKLLIRRASQGIGKKPGDWKAAQALGAITDAEEFVPQVRVHIATELDAVLDRLGEEFKDEPLILERAYRAVSLAGPAEPSGEPSPPTDEPV